MRSCVTCSSSRCGAAEQLADVGDHLARASDRRPRPGRARRRRCCASGQIFMPPPKKRPLPTAAIITRRRLRSCPSIVSQTSWLSCASSSRSVAPMKAIRPPNRFDDAFARARDGAGESERRDVHEVPHALAAVGGAVADAAGVDRARRRVLDVLGGGGDVVGHLDRAPEVAAGPARDEADLGRSRPRRPPSTPSATSEIVPSPPSARISRRPPAASRRAISVASRGPVVNALSSSPSPSASAPRTRAQRDSDMPPPRARVDDDEGAARIQQTLSNRPASRPVSSRARCSPAYSWAWGRAPAGRWRTSPSRGPGATSDRFARSCGRCSRARAWRRSRRRRSISTTRAFVVAGRLDRGGGRVVAARLRLHVLRLRARPSLDRGADHVVLGGDRRGAVAAGVSRAARGRAARGRRRCRRRGAVVVSRYAQVESARGGAGVTAALGAAAVGAAIGFGVLFRRCAGWRRCSAASATVAVVYVADIALGVPLRSGVRHGLAPAARRGLAAGRWRPRSSRPPASRASPSARARAARRWCRRSPASRRR